MTLAETQRQLEQDHKDASNVLRSFPRQANGLTPDAIKSSPEYIEAKRNYDQAFAALRAFNARFAKMLRKV